MEFALGHYRLHGNPGQLLSMQVSSSFYDDRRTYRFQSPAPARKILKKFHSLSSTALMVPSARCDVCRASFFQKVFELADINWDDIAFSQTPTDFMYAAKSLEDETFMKGELQRFGPIHMSPSAGVLNYGQGVFEGMKAYRKADGSILLFRPEENALRMRMGAKRMCMPAPTIEHFVDAVKQIVLANKRWVPPPGKGSLYIRPMLLGTGPVLGVAPALEYTFLIFVSPVGNYFKEGLAPLNLIIDTETHRAIPGGTGGVKAIGNYSPVLKAQSIAKAKGYSDVLYLDSIHKKYIEEISSCNIFVVKDNIISTPTVSGTILPGITRKSIIEVARIEGFQVEERPISVEELLDADEVFCTGTDVVVSPVGCITYLEKRRSSHLDRMRESPVPLDRFSRARKGACRPSYGSGLSPNRSGILP